VLISLSFLAASQLILPKIESRENKKGPSLNTCHNISSFFLSFKLAYINCMKGITVVLPHMHIIYFG
jgi:hypothetical protein